MRGDPPGARPGPLHQRTASDDAVERGRRRRQAGGQPFDLGVGAPQQRRHVLGGDVEGHRDRADAGLGVRLNQLRGIARLGEQHPDRLHGGRAGADVHREVGVGAERLARKVEGPNHRGVDGAVVGRIGQDLRPEMHGRSALPHQPVDEHAVVLGRIVGEENECVERSRRHNAPDGTAPGACAARAVEVGLADPGQEHRGHGEIINYFAPNIKAATVCNPLVRTVQPLQLYPGATVTTRDRRSPRRRKTTTAQSLGDAPPAAVR